MRDCGSMMPSPLGLGHPRLFKYRLQRSLRKDFATVVRDDRSATSHGIEPSAMATDAMASDEAVRSKTLFDLLGVHRLHANATALRLAVILRRSLSL